MAQKLRALVALPEVLIYNILPPCMPAHQKRAPDLSTDGCESPCGCRELNSEPLEEQPVILTPEPSLQPNFRFFESGFHCIVTLAILRLTFRSGWP